MTALLLIPSSVGAQRAVSPNENYYAAGEHVVLRAPVERDAVMAGRVVTIGQPVGGDVLAAGWQVTLNAPAADDVRMVGANVAIQSSVRGDLTAAAGDLSVAPGVEVSGRAWLSGGTVRLDGIFDRDVRIAADRVVIGGELRGPLQVTAQRLEILPTARVSGAIAYKGPQPAIVATTAVVPQPIAFTKIPASAARNARWPRGVSSVVFGTHLFIGGLLLLLLLPTVVGRPLNALHTAPAFSLLAGVAMLVTVPFVAVLLIVSLVGLPVGLILGAAYLAALFLGVVTMAIFVGDLEARLLGGAPMTTTGRKVLFLFAGVVTLGIIRSIPVLGTAVVVGAVVMGLGAIGLALYRGVSPTAVATAH